jgi:hypothetical protein
LRKNAKNLLTKSDSTKNTLSVNEQLELPIQSQPILVKSMVDTTTKRTGISYSTIEAPYSIPNIGLKK